MSVEWPTKRPGLRAKIARFLCDLDMKGEEHQHKDCPGWDHDEPEYCCTHCGCCPCGSIRCHWCRSKRLRYEHIMDKLHKIGWEWKRA